MGREERVCTQRVGETIKLRTRGREGRAKKEGTTTTATQRKERKKERKGQRGGEGISRGVPGW
jgi:hypothetical protein